MNDLLTRALKEIDQWIQKYRKLWEERFDRLDLLLRQEKKKLQKKGKKA